MKLRTKRDSHVFFGPSFAHCRRARPVAIPTGHPGPAAGKALAAGGGDPDLAHAAQWLARRWRRSVAIPAGHPGPVAGKALAACGGDPGRSPRPGGWQGAGGSRWRSRPVTPARWLARRWRRAVAAGGDPNLAHPARWVARRWRRAVVIPTWHTRPGGWQGTAAIRPGRRARMMSPMTR